MARMIGRFGSWMMWLGGFFMALIFGRGVTAAEMAAKYGVRIDPIDVETPQVTEAQKKKVNELIDNFVNAQVSPPALTAEQKATVEGAIKDWESKDFAKREAASAAVVKVGVPALSAIRPSTESKDPEVAWRAKAAGEKIQESLLTGLQAESWVTQRATTERIEKERKAAANLEAKAAEAEKAGNKDEAEKLRSQAKDSRARLAALETLKGKVATQVIISHPCEMIAPPAPKM